MARDNRSARVLRCVERSNVGWPLRYKSHSMKVGLIETRSREEYSAELNASYALRMYVD